MAKKFEESMEELEKVVKKLENGEITLDESIKEFEHGMALVKECREGLENAKQRITKVLENGGEAPFEEEKNEQ